MMTAIGRRALLASLLATGLTAGAAAQPQTQPPAPAVDQARQLFLFVYRPGPAWVAGRPMTQQDLRPHGLYIGRLLREGRVFAGGGFVGRDGGMAIVRATDLEEAQALLAADPAISSGVFVAEVRQWAPRFHTPEPLVEGAR